MRFWETRGEEDELLGEQERGRWSVSAGFGKGKLAQHEQSRLADVTKPQQALKIDKDEL
jgi:hypothetical protein